jgi:hypothetical protein
MLLLLYCMSLLLKVWQRSGSCCCCYSFYHYCSRFDRGVVHVLVVILSTIAVYCLTEEWFMLLYCLQLLFNIWQRSGSCYCCYFVYHYCLRFDRRRVHIVGDYIVYHYCLRFDRGVIHVVVVVILSTITVWGLTEDWFMLLLYCIPLLFKVWQRSCSCYCYYIVFHYCVRFDRG